MSSSKQKDFTVTPFVATADDPLRIEHQIVGSWAVELLESLPAHAFYQDVEIKSTPSGKTIFAADAESSRRLVMAALLQVIHWDREAERVRAQGENEIQRMNAHSLPGWAAVWGRRRQTAAVMHTLLKRSLPFSEADLITLANWVADQEQLSIFHTPVGALGKTFARFAKTNPVNDSFRDALRRCAQRLRRSHEKSAKLAATTIEQVAGSDQVDEPDEPAVDARPIVVTSAGNPAVLVQLKQRIGLLPDDDVATEEILPDHFNLRADSPLVEEHALLTSLFGEVIGKTGYHSIVLEDYEHGRAILDRDSAAMGRLLLAAAERGVGALLFGQVDYNDHAGWQSRYAAHSMPERLSRRSYALTRDGLFDFVLYLSARPAFNESFKVELLLSQITLLQYESPLTEGERYALSLWRFAMVQGPLLGTVPPGIAQMNRLIGYGAGFYLGPDEEWSVMLNRDIHALPAEQRTKWIALLKHWLTATATRPSEKWLKSCGKLVNDISGGRVRKKLVDWLSSVPAGRATTIMPSYHGDTRTAGDVIQQENANCLRGMLWTLPSFKKDRDEIARVISTVAQSAYKKIPGVGPRAVKVGNSAIYALSELGTTDAVGKLAMLKVRVKFGTAQKEIEKAFNSAAEALGLPRDEIEELGVPTYGLEDVGVRREVFGDAAAELRVDGRDVTIHWTSGGKAVKSVPAKVKADHKDELKELQNAAKDIAGMLPAQSERLDAMFLAQKQWPAAVWRERYLDHPLVGTLARRLIWRDALSDGTRSFIWHEGRLVDHGDKPVELTEASKVALWHPIDQPTEDVLAWRRWLEKHEVRQPFKQAHRELYLLTDAERRTATYSNRFAAHVLRQHQFNALCAARGWKNKLRLLVDDAYPPASRSVPQWGLRAEYWIEGIGDNYGTDTNDSGAFLRIVTDQVRFYRTTAAPNVAHAGGGGYTANALGPGAENINEPLAIDQIPPLVLSEILRDVDLFVGVASIGNDPTWQDGGPGGRYQTYWQSYSFGELTETAQTRKAVLQTLLPRLTKLRDRWRLDDKFLIIRGELRTYKIHLGSGNILMEPNDQYLCIVPDRSTKTNDEVFLPFEGDATLSIILSKAFLLAGDKKIEDPTITRQIRL